MSSRPSRSASIPIPGSGARNIENVITIPFATTSSRPRLVTPSRLQATASTSPERSLAGRTSISISPVRTMSGGMFGRSPSVTSPPAFEPRIIRATTSPSRAGDPACVPAPTSPVHAPMGRTRRPSAARQASAAATAASGVSRTTATQVSAPTTVQPTAFPRPPYLDHSALRDFLLTDAPPPQHVNAPGDAAAAGSSRMGTPVPAPYPYLRSDSSLGMDTDEESNASMSPPPLSRSAPAPAPGTLLINPALRLPTRWSEQDKHQLLTVSLDGRDLTFYGQSCIGERDSAAARANHPIPPACGVYYYEVEILQKGTKGHISIGFSAPDVRLSRLPGWEKNTWGYHADDGWSFPGHKEGNPYGPTFDTGDIIGCGIDFTQHRAFYTKNGTFLGMVFENVGKDSGVYPAIGLRHTSESIRVNFGHTPFKYAIEDHVHAQRNAVWSNIQTTTIDWNLLYGKDRRVSDESTQSKEAGKTSAILKGGALEEEQMKSPVRKLVLSYLAHHGYARTARAFQRECEGRRDIPDLSVDAAMDTAEGPHASSSTAELDAEFDLHSRIDVVNAVLRGDVDSAITQTQRDHPTVMEREQGLMLFKLRCRKFVELILEASEALKRVQAEEKERNEALAREREREKLHDESGMDESGAMDVDDPSPEAHLPSDAPLPSRDTDHRAQLPPSPLALHARTTLHAAIEYGQSLEADYKHDVRPEVRGHLKRTFGVVAYADPLAAGGEVAEMAGREARSRLANELNQAILESQGKPAHPALETLYRQTAACVMQLGLVGVGSAAFADMSKEFMVEV